MSRILLIEPDRVLAKVYSQALEQAGHEVAVCASAQAGILVADRIQPDLVILELQLTSHSGIEFLYEFRSYPDWQATPILIHSHVPADEFTTSQDLIKQLGVIEYLYKPHTTLEHLLTTIERELTVPA